MISDHFHRRIAFVRENNVLDGAAASMYPLDCARKVRSGAPCGRTASITERTIRYSMHQSYHLSASLEDYIEAIYNIMSEKQTVRSKDIAARLEVSGASVTEALRSLARKGLINYAPYEPITLTGSGRLVALDVIRRHNALKQFFVEVLGIENDLAEQGACRVEHAAPQEIIDRIIRFTRFLESRPEENQRFVRKFLAYCRETPPPE